MLLLLLVVVVLVVVLVVMVLVLFQVMVVVKMLVDAVILFLVRQPAMARPWSPQAQQGHTMKASMRRRTMCVGMQLDGCSYVRRGFFLHVEQHQRCSDSSEVPIVAHPEVEGHHLVHIF